jgi:2-keto-3-deoxy-L-rhamnonate aldolase RhmA/CMP-N-acetylneuraminic acid synthetase
MLNGIVPKIVAVVPIKLNSERLVNKNILPFTNGKPLCWYIFETLHKVKGLQSVYCYCSNSDIRKNIPEYVTLKKRSESLDQSTTKMNEVLSTFADDVPSDYYVMAHTTAPFISATSIQRGIDAVLSGKYDSAFSVSLIQDFLWKDNTPFNYSLESIPRTQDLEPIFMETSGFYIYDNETIKVRQRRIGDKPFLVPISSIEATDIDEKEDFEIADALYDYSLKKKLNLRSRLHAGDVVSGIFMKTCDPMFVEIASHSGLDYVILDMEHGPVSLESQQNNIRAAQTAGIVPVVRVNGKSEHSIGSVLDIGAKGVQIPQIQTAEEARIAVEFARFHPYGNRGVCRFVRAAKYSAIERINYFEQSKDLLVILQIEGIIGLSNLDEILSVNGIDVVFIGPYDLSQSLGFPGQVTNPIVVAAMRDAVCKARAKGVIVGTFVDDKDQARRWIEAGVQYISFSTDAGVFLNACSSIVYDINELVNIKKSGGGGGGQK